MLYVHPLPFDRIFLTEKHKNMINQNPENPLSKACLFAPFVCQAEQLSLTRSVMRPRAGQTGLWAITRSHVHTHALTALGEFHKHSSNAKLGLEHGPRNQAVLVFIAVLNPIPCSRSAVVKFYCCNATVVASRRNPSVWLGLCSFGWGRGLLFLTHLLILRIEPVPRRTKRWKWIMIIKGR